MRARWAAALALMAAATACTSGRPAATGSRPPTPPTTASPPARPPHDPDIFYIVLDDYGGQRAMKDLLGFDNTPFLDALRARGFYVPGHPTTNYPRTAMSLASSLNLDYVQALLRPLPAEQDSTAPLVPLPLKARVPRYLQSMGYRYVHVGSWWPATVRSPDADRNVVMKGTVEEVAARLHVALPEPGPGEPLPTYRWERREYLRVLFQFEQLANMKDPGRPTFVFAHILSPHRPVMFDRQGRFVSPLQRDRLDEATGYVDQVRAVNDKVLRLVDTLQDVPPAHRPVIIVQSDEGFYEALQNGANARDDVVEQHFGTLAAYDFPGVADRGLSPTMTPVNLFRVLFDDYFDAGMPLLPDRNYLYPNVRELFTFTDVTDRVRALS